tara:strand:+ start:824 stop:1324 length:501 start_codon:yes stop_codon:yes gene_type:complete
MSLARGLAISGMGQSVKRFWRGVSRPRVADVLRVYKESAQAIAVNVETGVWTYLVDFRNAALGNLFELAAQAVIGAAPIAATVPHFDFAPFGGGVFYWTPVAGETALDLVVWAKNGNGDWVQIYASTSIPPNTEVVFTGVNRRGLYFQPTVITGGGGTVNLIATGV